jgi:oligosaccharyltransferase complex subunit gamma
MLKLLAVLASAFLPLSLAASNPQADLAKLAASNGGVIKLDQKSFDAITSPKRNWTAAVHFTAMDPRRKCNPCK